MLEINGRILKLHSFFITNFLRKKVRQSPKKGIFGKSQKLSQSKFSSIRSADFSSIWRNFFWRKFWSRPIWNLNPEWNLPIVVTAVNEKNRELKKSQDGIGVHGSSDNVSFKTFIMSSNKSIWSSCSEPFNFPILYVRFCRLLLIRWKSSFAFACKFQFTIEAKEREWIIITCSVALKVNPPIIK